GGGDVTGVGVDLAAALSQALPAAAQPFIPNIIAGIHDAFSLAVAATFQIGVVTAVAAFVAALALQEIPLRRTTGPGHEPSPGAERRRGGREAPAERVTVTASPARE